MKPLIITLLASLVLFLPAHKAHLEGGAVSIHKYAIKPEKPLSVPDLKPQEQLASVYVAPDPAPAPTPVAAPAPVNGASAGCGDNQYANYIYMHESGCRTNAVNEIGACGIGQAYPCSKMGCSLSDYACQNAFFSNYAVSRYGGWYEAYLYWLSNHLW